MVWILGQFLQDQVEKRWQGNSSSTLQMREVSAEMYSLQGHYEPCLLSSPTCSYVNSG